MSEEKEPCDHKHVMKHQHRKGPQIYGPGSSGQFVIVKTVIDFKAHGWLKCPKCNKTLNVLVDEKTDHPGQMELLYGAATSLNVSYVIQIKDQAAKIEALVAALGVYGDKAVWVSAIALSGGQPSNCLYQLQGHGYVHAQEVLEIIENWGK